MDQPSQPTITELELEAYLEEALPADEMSRVEALVRCDAELLQRLGRINARRDTGAHSIGAIWRRKRLTCPSREQLGAFVLGTMTEEEEEYLNFHLRVIGCRCCAANLEDFRSRQAESDDSVETRRRRYFHSSVGHLRPRRKPADERG